MPKTWRTTSTNLSRIFWWSSRYKSFSVARSGAHQPAGARELARLPPAVDYNRAGIPCCYSAKWKGASREGIIRKASPKSTVEGRNANLDVLEAARAVQLYADPPLYSEPARAPQRSPVRAAARLFRGRRISPRGPYR